MKTVIVTGASSGIGATTARAFLEAGWHVGLLARRKDALEAIAAERDNTHVLSADVSNPSQVEHAFADFIERAGRLDVLFNNAGIFGPAGDIDQIDVADWQRVLDVNLTGMFLCARAAFAQMRQQHQGGRIINNGSISAHVPRAGAACYTVTKHAITGLTKQLSLDGRDQKIACGQIDIGNAATEMVAELAKKAPDTTPTMDVEDVARGVLYMADLPIEANVQFMTVMAREMPYIGRG